MFFLPSWIFLHFCGRNAYRILLRRSCQAISPMRSAAYYEKSAETIRNNNFPYRPPRLSSRVCIPHCTAAPICSLHTGTGEAAACRKNSEDRVIVRQLFQTVLYVRRPSAIGPAHKNRRDKHLRPLPRQNSCHSRPKPHRCLPAPPLQDEHSHRTSARWYSVPPPSRGTIGQTTRTKNPHTVLASMNILRGPAVPPRGQDME